jgi:2-methylcitrate dehydratase PrpD
LSAYAAERRADPRLHALIERIAIDIDENVAGSDRASVIVVTRDGSHIEEPTATALGAPENPLGDGALLAKFNQLARYTLTPSQARGLADFTFAVESVEDARDLPSLLRPHRH